MASVRATKNLSQVPIPATVQAHHNTVSPNLTQSSISSTRFYFLLFFIPIVITVVHEIIVTFLDDSGSPYITPKVKQELPTFYSITFIQKDTMCHQGQKYQFITILKANIILFVVLRLKNFTEARM